ncbi:Peptidase family A1 domain profile [Nakaseomyces glabratus]
MRIDRALTTAAAAGYLRLPFIKITDNSLAKRADDDYLNVQLDNEQIFYGVEVSIGSDKQNMTLLVDTGSSDFWVLGAQNPYCKSNRGKKPKKKDQPSSVDPGRNGYPTKAEAIPYAERTFDCSDFKTFNSSSSNTFKSNDTDFFITYGDGSYVEGTWGTDQVALAGQTLENVTFAVAELTNNSYGLLGIGLPELESSITIDTAQLTNTSSVKKNPYMNFPESLKLNKLINKVVYSIYLNRTNDKFGSILFGAVDHNRYDGNLTTVPLVFSNRDFGTPRPNELMVTLNGMSFEATDGNVTQILNATSKFPALLDTGSTDTHLPVDIYNALAESTNGTYDQTQNKIRIPKCLSKKDKTILNFSLGGVNIGVPYKEMVKKIKGKCYINVAPTGSDFAILGDDVIRYAYMVFDLEDREISLAQASFNDTLPEDIEVVVSTIPGATRASAYSETYSPTFAVPSASSSGNTSSNGSTNLTRRFERRDIPLENKGVPTSLKGSVAAILLLVLWIA